MVGESGIVPAISLLTVNIFNRIPTMTTPPHKYLRRKRVGDKINCKIIDTSSFNSIISPYYGKNKGQKEDKSNP
jgi:hypothetical protein